MEDGGGRDGSRELMGDGDGDGWGTQRPEWLRELFPATGSP